MLTMKSRMHAKGFSVMDADELYFINGGSGTYGHGAPKGPQGSTSGKTATQVIKELGASMEKRGEEMLTVGVIAQGIAACTPVPIDDAGAGLWNAAGGIMYLTGKGIQGK